MARLLAQRDLRVSIVNARLIRDLAKAMGQLTKTDALDAQVIAKSGEVRASVFASETEAELKGLCDTPSTVGGNAHSLEKIR